MTRTFLLILLVFVINSLKITSTQDDFDRELQYCCPMPTDKVKLLIDRIFCVGVYNERRVLNLDCDDKVGQIGIIEYSTNGTIHKNHKKFCFVTEIHEKIQIIAICIEKPFRKWHLDLPTYGKCLSIIFLCMTLYGYSRIESLRRPEDIPFMIFTCILMIGMTIDVVCMTLERVFAPTVVPKVVVYMQFYTIIGSFVWMNVILVYQLRENLYRGIVRPYWMLLTHFLGWTGPLILQTILMYLSGDWMFLKDACLFILWINSVFLIIFLLVTASALPRRVCKRYRNMLKYRSILYLKLFIITEFLWIFQFFAVFFMPNNFFLTIDCILSLQGVFMFYLMVMKRYHVRKILGEKGVFCLMPVEKQVIISDEDSDVELVQLGCKISDV